MQVKILVTLVFLAACALVDQTEVKVLMNNYFFGNTKKIERRNNVTFVQLRDI